MLRNQSPWLRRPQNVVAVAALCFGLAACRTPAPLSSVKDDSASGIHANGNGQAATGVLQHHNHANRDGVYADAAFTRAAAATLHHDAAFSATYQGMAYAQPLYVANGPGGKAIVVVATEADTVMAFDAASGAQIWTQTLGAPIAKGNLPCGNIDTLGVTGTPVIDPASRTLVVGAMTQAADGSARHKVYALSIDDGSVQSGWPVDVGALNAGGVAFDSSVQNQRGALALLNGTVYVPYGGHFGDCGVYHGWVVGVPLANPAQATAWATRGAGGGIWAPSGISHDGTSLYVSTGNSFNATTWADGEGLIRLSPAPAFSTQPADFFAPTNWQDLDANDVDVGGSGIMPVHVNGSTPAELAVAFGKDGNIYMVDRANMGGIGNALSSLTVNSDEIITAPAAYTTSQGTFTVFHAYQGTGAGCPAGQRGTLVAVKINAGQPPVPSVAWCANSIGKGSPAVSTTDGQAESIVWVVGSEADNKLRGYNAETGAVVFAGGGTSEVMAKVRRFATPIIANGHVYVAGDNQLYSFSIQ